MGFSEAVTTCLNKYVDFKGRARRSEFWYFVLFQFILSILAAIIDKVIFGTNGNLLGAVVALGLFLPGLAVSVRRLHDINRSGWWVLVALIPLIGWLVVLYWNCQKGTDGANQFGDAPA